MPEKRVADPVHGTIGLTDVEVAVLDTRAFQRLRNVKQLGLAGLVFPGADFSRLSHCLGVCHVTGQILDALRRTGQAPGISEDDAQLYRLAGLLHDVGHYPFSHSMERAIKEHHSRRLLTPAPSGGGEQGVVSEDLESFRYFEHERVGKEILDRDAELNGLLRSHSVDPRDVYDIFMRQNPTKLINLISSDLDADRIDFLLRTAHHTGLPYGSVDLPYLISQMRVDRDGRICLTRKALRAADHFLLCRHFDRQQVAFHKTVAALELVLEDVLGEMLRQGRIRGDARWVSDSVDGGEWYAFDDSLILEKIRTFQRETADDVDRLKATSIIDRMPPKLVAEVEFLAWRNPDNRDRLKSKRQLILARKAEVAQRYGIDERLWYLWSPRGMTFTRAGSQVSSSSVLESPGDFWEEYEQAIRILESQGRTSVPIYDFQNSLMRVLSNYELYAVRLYVLLPPTKQALIDDLRSQFLDVM